MTDGFSFETFFVGISHGADAINVFGLEYLTKHRKRFQITVEMLRREIPLPRRFPAVARGHLLSGA